MSGYPGVVKLVASQTAYQLRYFARVPVALFFTVLLPVIFLVIFGTIFGDHVKTAINTRKTILARIPTHIYLRKTQKHTCTHNKTKRVPGNGLLKYKLLKLFFKKAYYTLI